MVLVDWIDKMIHQGEWAIPLTKFQKGDHYNIFADDISFDGTFSHEHLFRGKINIPLGQLQRCCIDSQGKSHRCDHGIVRQISQTVILKLPETSMTNEQCKLVGMIGLANAVYDGKILREEGDEMTGEFGDVSPIFDRTVERIPKFASEFEKSSIHQCVSRGQESQQREIENGKQYTHVFCAMSGISTIYLKPCVMSLPDTISEKYSLIELFAGGFAGWSQAACVLQKLGVAWESTVAVELDKCIGQMYANNCCCEIIDADDINFCMSNSLTAERKGSILFRGSVCDRGFTKLVPWMHRQVATISSPCPPWTKASVKDGLNHPEGQLFPFTAAELRFLRPDVIAAEQVETFRSHEHFQGVIDAFKWAGYQLIWETCSDLKDVSPITRKRWLGVFVPLPYATKIGNKIDLIKLPKTNVFSFHALVQLPRDHEDELILTEDMIDIYSDPMLSKPGKGQFGIKSREHVLQERVKGPFAELNTVMAMYGNQHSLSMNVLKEKGLFTELTQCNNEIRFWSPFEFAVMHCRNTCWCIPKMSRLGHLTIGNSIAVPHAVLALTVARNAIDINAQLDPAEAAMKSVLMRLNSRNAHVVSNGDEWALIPNSGCVHEPRHHEYASTLMDESSHITEIEKSVCEISPTMSFELTCQVHCTHPDEVEHIYQVLHGSKLDEIFVKHECGFFRGSTAVMTIHGDLISHFHVVEDDMRIVVRWDCREFREVVCKRGTWFVVPENVTPNQYMKTCGIADFGLQVFDVAFNEVSINQSCTSMRVFFALEINIAHWKPWKPSKIEITCIQDCIDSLHLLIPQCDVSPHVICFAANDLSCRDDLLFDLNHIFAPLEPLFGAAGWDWNNHVTNDEFHSGKLGSLYPTHNGATPVHTMMFPILRNLVMGSLSTSCRNPSIMVKIKFDGVQVWHDKLDESIRIQQLHTLINEIGCKLGFCQTRLVWKGKVNWSNETLGEIFDGAVLRFHFVDALHGGGAKIDGWKETKSLLAKELIQHGWPVTDLENLTNDWCQRIGASKLMNSLKISSAEKRWVALLDCAKWHGLATTPDDPVKMKAIKTIQKAFRKAMPNKALTEALRIAPGFFHQQDDLPARVLDKLDLKSSGVCMLDFDSAIPWIRKEFPVVSDELGIITLFRSDLPSDLPTPKEVTFPVLDSRGRQSIARGHLWQLGEKCVKISPNSQPIDTDDTMVLACAIWRDECNEQQWQMASTHLVKTAFQMIDKVDTKGLVLQVWGRCFRDHQKRTEPIHALSGQFHLRIFTRDVETFLKVSGANAVYFTPKNESHLSHPGWGMIWLKDKVEVQIACEKSTCHSGIARSKDRYALRVVADKIEAIAKEVHPTNPPKHSLPVDRLYKVEPMPLGITPQNIVNWAKNLGWEVRVIKMLGRSAALLGTSHAPPHEHMLTGEKSILIRPVKTDRNKPLKSSLVAGPRPVVNKSPSGDGVNSGVDEVFNNDPWAKFKGTGMNGVDQTKGSTPNNGSRTVDGPTNAKFHALEERLSKYETALTEIRQEQKQVVEHIKQQDVVVQKQIHGVEAKLGSVQQSLEQSMETAIVRAMGNQEKRLDAKFDKLLAAMTGQKRAVPESDDDSMNGTPGKLPAAKR